MQETNTRKAILHTEFRSAGLYIVFVFTGVPPLQVK
jgi:hypothetical protein